MLIICADSVLFFTFFCADFVLAACYYMKHGRQGIKSSIGKLYDYDRLEEINYIGGNFAAAAFADNFSAKARMKLEYEAEYGWKEKYNQDWEII